MITLYGEPVRITAIKDAGLKAEVRFDNADGVGISEIVPIEDLRADTIGELEDALSEAPPK